MHCIGDNKAFQEDKKIIMQFDVDITPSTSHKPTFGKVDINYKLE